MEAEENKKVIDVFPLSKGRRILSFLADYFICFILGLALFHLAVYPIGRLISDSDGQATSLIEAQKKRDSVLYGNELLYYDSSTSGTSPASFSTNLEYSSKLYLIDFLKTPKEEEHDVYKRYFVDIRKKTPANWLSFCKEKSLNSSFFTFEEDSMSLKEEYVAEFAPLLNDKDELSEKGKEDYALYQEKYFLQLYSSLLSDIETNDLVYQGVSYKACQDTVASILAKQQKTILFSSLISEFLSLSICFFMAPMISRYRKTLGMMALRAHRVSFSSLKIVGRKDVFPYWIYQIALNFSSVFFLPLPVLGFNELFTLTLPFFLSLASLAIVIISFFVILINSFGRSLLDLSTDSMLITNDQLDEIYHAKGYEY